MKDKQKGKMNVIQGRSFNFETFCRPCTWHFVFNELNISLNLEPSSATYLNRFSQSFTRTCIANGEKKDISLKGCNYTSYLHTLVSGMIVMHTLFVLLNLNHCACKNVINPFILKHSLA